MKASDLVGKYIALRDRKAVMKKEYEDKVANMVGDSRKELSHDDKPGYNLNPKVGIMVETPAAVQNLRDLTEGVDFYKIGTNDLAHHTLGIGIREDNPDKDPYEPQVFHNIFTSVSHGIHCDKPTGICGDMASRVTGALMLLGMCELARESMPGDKTPTAPFELSMGSLDMLVVKKAISSVKAADMKEIAREVLKKTDYPTTKNRLDAAIGERSRDLHDSTDVLGYINGRLVELGVNMRELDPFEGLRD